MRHTRHRINRITRAATALCVVALSGWAAVSTAQATPSAPVRAAAADGTCDVLAPGASAVAEKAVRAACGQLGVWYSWGGGHGAQPGATYGQVDPSDPASNHDPERRGFDCSGLVRFAYAQATGQDILNGTSRSQFNTTHASARFSAAQGTAPLRPGDLLAYGNGGAIHHIAVYLGAGKMVEARQSGTHVMVSDARVGGDYAGAVRIDGAAAPGGGFSTWGTDVWTHADASTTSARVYKFAGPTSVKISCQKHAQSVTAEGFTNDAWSYLPDYRAWITNIYIKGPAWLVGVPTCP